MPSNIPRSVAEYYDLNPLAPPDVPFYASLVPSRDATVLELGCGTGRVLLPLAQHSRYVHGVDASETMLVICRAKLRRAGIPTSRVEVTTGDVTGFHLPRTFDLILAPYRLVQTLETDAQLDGLFRCIQAHLAPGGTCILNVARPKAGPEELCRTWASEAERFCWETPVEGGRVICHERRRHIQVDPMVLYPELIWRRYAGDAMVDEVELRIPMRHHDPDEFSGLIERHGFSILNQWGGYSGEEYGRGAELIVQFQRLA